MGTIVLDVAALPRSSRSRTQRLRQAFFESYLASHPDATRVEVDLARGFDTLPALDEWDIAAKFEVMYGEGKLDETQADRWDSVSRFTDQLHQASVIVVSAPMWNFGIPWMLKRWIDTVVQAKLTFDYRDGNYVGLLAGRQAVILTTRDGAYVPGTDFGANDHMLPYLRTILGFVGLGPIREVTGEPMAALGPDEGARALEAAVQAARKRGAEL